MHLPKPEGLSVSSRWRQPPELKVRASLSPEGATAGVALVRRVARALSPLRGSAPIGRAFRGLTAPAIHGRPFGPEGTRRWHG